ncbi:hypothetical protein LJR027_004102 [Terrabacter sp. LjRoot27]|uniref:hypothetical protein n=1 Tax=Terrabacter sp. LjRoot27 TaxID=3342306 RepID=UPI003ECDA556
MTTTNRRQIPCGTESFTAGTMRAVVRRLGSTRIRRRASIALFVAVAALAVSHQAAALMPIPPAPVRFPIADIGHTILTVAEQCSQAPIADNRRLHNEMVLLITTGHAAI